MRRKTSDEIRNEVYEGRGMARIAVDAKDVPTFTEGASSTTEYGRSLVSPSDPGGLPCTGKITGPKLHDARIAAICKSHGVRELWSAGRDFSRMPGDRVTNLYCAIE